jgi:two-component system OmpR family response regulator
MHGQYLEKIGRVGAGAVIAYRQEAMGASTIVVAREDLSIPGASGACGDPISGPADLEAQFFNVLREHQPDVVVLDLRDSCEQGIGAILKVRRRSATPIVVVCTANDPLIREYCLAGAAECMEAPVDIVLLNQTVQKIIQLSKGAPAAAIAPETGPFHAVSFAGLVLYTHENLLVAGNGARSKLTTSENRVLLHFVSNPWLLCTRDAIAEALYGPRRPNSDRAIDVIVTRLRKKIAMLAGADAQQLIKTEFRRGYVFVAEVTCDAPPARQEAEAGLRARSA